MRSRIPACATLLLAVLAGPVRAAVFDEGIRSVDEELVRVGDEVPGFGGLFYDEEGNPAVYLTDPEGPGAAIVKSMGEEVRVLRGDYEFRQLAGWKIALRPVLGLPGVVTLDADEARNRVVVGVDARSKSLDRGELERELIFQGVPREAVVFEEVSPLREWIGVRDRFRPVPGGVQILVDNNSRGASICTFGFNARRGKVWGFVINSHCSDVRGQVDFTRYYQSSYEGGAIGTEMIDPPYWTGAPCPPERRCRFSDSAFVKYDRRSLGAFGKIARPKALGSLVLQNASARFTITGRFGTPLRGETVHKVGSTTSWSQGKVRRTCADANLSTSDFTLLCQTFVRANGGPGDSGSPVFYLSRRNSAGLLGILWGGGTDDEGFVEWGFSPLASIERELGALKVH